MVTSSTYSAYTVVRAVGLYSLYHGLLMVNEEASTGSVQACNALLLLLFWAQLLTGEPLDGTAAR